MEECSNGRQFDGLLWEREWSLSPCPWGSQGDRSTAERGLIDDLKKSLPTLNSNPSQTQRRSDEFCGQAWNSKNSKTCVRDPWWGDQDGSHTLQELVSVPFMETTGWKPLLRSLKASVNTSRYSSKVCSGINLNFESPSYSFQKSPSSSY